MKILTKTIETTFLHASIPHGWGNGYVGVPRGHPWFEMDYDSIHANFPDVSVHGGLTFSAHELKDEKDPEVWWVGFDTSHWKDDASNCPKSYVEREVENLKRMAEEAIPK